MMVRTYGKREEATLLDLLGGDLIITSDSTTGTFILESRCQQDIEGKLYQANEEIIVAYSWPEFMDLVEDMFLEPESGDELSYVDLDLLARKAGEAVEKEMVKRLKRSVDEANELLKLLAQRKIRSDLKLLSFGAVNHQEVFGLNVQVWKEI